MGDLSICKDFKQLVVKDLEKGESSFYTCEIQNGPICKRFVNESQLGMEFFRVMSNVKMTKAKKQINIEGRSVNCEVFTDSPNTSLDDFMEKGHFYIRPMMKTDT